MDQIADIESYQLVQTAPTILRVRLRLTADAHRDRVWQAAERAIRHALDQHNAQYVAVQRGQEAPEPSPGGKYRRIVPFEKRAG